MNHDRYPLKSDKSLATFELVSVGAKGRVVKLIQITATNLPNVYNLAFGDKNSETGKSMI